MTVLETRNLVKSYGEGEASVQALKGVSLQIASGQYVAIVGPSGSGKSTLLTILGGIETPTSGQVLLEGTDLATLSDDDRTILRRRRIGFIFQAFNLLPNLTAKENVALPIELDGTSQKVAYEKAAAALEMVEMTHRLDHLPNALSGGEQQRVAVARALAIEPAILMADEPTGNLDSKQSHRISDLLQRLVTDRGQTIVMVTHDRTLAKKAFRVITMQDGLIEFDGSSDDLSVSPALVAGKDD